MFNGKLALVTGASRGIGKAIAQKLSIQGAEVFGTATNQDNVNKINNFLSKKGKGILMDFSDLNSIKKSLKNASTDILNIDILVNNAAITYDNLLLRTKHYYWEKIININLTSIFFLSKIVIKNMLKKRFGRIINIGSVVGSIGNAGQTIYSITKSGLVGFSKSLSHEISSRGITINVVAPGFIETDMIKNLSKKQHDSILEKIPLHRLGKVEEVAEVVVFLASDKASYITGETIHVNGGMYMS